MGRSKLGELIKIPYKPRPQFVAYHAAEKRFSVTVAHRRAGKSVARINRLIRAAMTIPRRFPAGRFGYVSPYRNQSKKIAWQYLQHYAEGLIMAGGKKNEAELVLTMPATGATIELFGADNAEAMRGLYFDGIVTDEAQLIPRHVLSQIILPCLADYRGWLDCSGTPRGWQNLLGELVKMAQGDPENWLLQILKASETGIIAEDELARQRAIMSENEYQQEFECSFEAAITGAVYGKWIAEARAQNRIMAALPVANVPVHTAWDLGFDDATAIWWFQILGNVNKPEIRILDYYENNGEDIPFYCEIVRQKQVDKGWQYGKHYVPHDAAHELLAAGGRSIIQRAWAECGFRMTKVDATSQQNSIEAARATLEVAWFDADACEIGLEALAQYQFIFDQDKKTFKSKPHHNWASHGADAFEIIGQVWKAPPEEKKPEKPRFLDEMTFDELVARTPKPGTRI